MLDIYAATIREALADHPNPERLRDLQARASEVSTGGPSRVLADRLGLSPQQLQILWTLAAIAAIPGIRALVQQLGSTRSGDPTMDTLRQIAFGPHVDLRSLAETGPQGALQELVLLQRTDDGDAASHRQTWALSPRVLAFLLGDPGLDPELRAVASTSDVAPPRTELAIDDIAAHALDAAFARTPPLVQIHGLPGLGRRTALRCFARERGLALLEIDAGRLATDDAALRVQLRQLARECLMLARIPLVVGLDRLAEAARQRLTSELLARVAHLGFLATARVRVDLRAEAPLVAIELVRPEPKQLEALWRRGLGDMSDEDAAHLASRYPLAPSRIVRAARHAREAARDGVLGEDGLCGAVAAVTDDVLSEFGRRLVTTQAWKDLVLPADQTARVTELVARVRDRARVFEDWGFRAKIGKGLGVCALFSGPPGCGKSMCAALIADELALPVYAIDSSKISSKWIGETEKNLAAIFDAAETTCSILLFDEADALFGKRSEVKSSNDKHANAEVSYLLQRIEQFTGVCILTSNHESAIDPAFQRRLAVHVRFELPDEDERERLWRAMIPASAPIARDVDFAELARRYEMSGGYIKNAVVRAAFLAARDEQITARQLHHAARLECEAMGRVVF